MCAGHDSNKFPTARVQATIVTSFQQQVCRQFPNNTCAGHVSNNFPTAGAQAMIVIIPLFTELFSTQRCFHRGHHFFSWFITELAGDFTPSLSIASHNIETKRTEQRPRGRSYMRT